MFLASLPFIRYVATGERGCRAALARPQVRAYLRWLMGAVLMVTLHRVLTTGAGWEVAFRESLFNLTSIMSSTGFFSGSFPAWGALHWSWPS
jgi:trk system potassium uptake protein